MKWNIHMLAFSGLAACFLLSFPAALVLAQTQQSLAPPPPPLVEGRTVDVVPHADIRPFLGSDDPKLAANKGLVFDMWRTVINAARVDQVERFFSPDHVEYSVVMAAGRQGFADYHAAQVPGPLSTVPDTIADPVVAIVAERDMVGVATVTHYLEPDGSGDTYTSTSFDLFQIRNGRIVAHWDSRLPARDQHLLGQEEGGPSPVQGTEGFAQLPMIHNDKLSLANNKRLVFDLWRHTAEAGREEMAQLYLDPVYIQHNPNAVTGREGFMEYFAMRPDTSIEPYFEAPLVTMIAEGDLVLQALQGERVNPNNPDEMIRITWFDLFRVQDGRAIEHWDAAAKGEFPTIMQER